ncbi:MAG: FAD-dependent oxidoreductase, partial [Planctomycetota bacterium]
AFFYEQGRKPSDPRGGFWWIEIGIPWHTIHDNETIRHELTRHALGVWDWMKNRDPRMRERCRTYALDFIGQVPGKRESRRIVGRHWLDENALQAREHFPDEIAFGGWFVDLHTPGGLLAPTSEPASAEGYRPDSEYAAKSYIGPYGIPLRSLMARDVDNCFLAGRCISTTRAALGTVRVMATTALMGEAVGTAAGIMREQELDLPALATDCETGGPVIRAVQQRLLRRGNWLPHVAHADPGDLARQARASASSSALLHGQSPADPILRGNLKWRPRGEHESCAQRQAQIVFLDGGALDSIELQLVGQGRLAVRLVRVTDIWDYRVGGSAVVAEGTLDVDGEQPCWYAWHCGLRDLPAGAYRIETGPGADAVSWSCVLGLQPGCVAQYHCSPTRLRARHNGQAFRLSPPQAVYGPEQVLSGVSRPQAASNCWRSDAGAGLPQWLQLDWDGRQRIGSVELCLAGHLLVEVHAEPPFYRDRQTLRDYCIQVPDAAGGWRDCLRVTDNYRRHRVHPLPEPVETDRLRLLCLATNGDPAACVYELRCYAGSGPS